VAGRGPAGRSPTGGAGAAAGVAGAPFGPDLFAFLRDLAAHNDRTWFQDHKARYDASARRPLLAFIAAFAPRLAKISPHLVADPRPVGGSMFRIHRDTRFSKDKRPYKTHVAAQFRHRGPADPLAAVLEDDPDLPFGPADAKAAAVPAAGNVHGPGFYLHLEPGEVFMGAGMWRPDGPVLKAVRDRIAARPDDWRRVRRATLGRRGLYLDGDALKRPPRGYDPEHPCIEDLKRKDFIVVADLSEEAALAPDFLDTFTACCKAAAPLMRFLTEAAGLPW
jgi:uncharacterized protein (DUF2461 family)